MDNFKGEQASKKEAPIIVACPHSSIVDNLLIQSCPRPFFTVARNEQGFLATLLRVLCAIFTERSDPQSGNYSNPSITTV